MGSTRAVETQRTAAATTLDTGVVTPPQPQPPPQHHLVITMLAPAVLLLCSLAVSAQYQCNPASAGLSDNCIGCICEASTSCNKNAKCINGDSFCGPFLISKGFWIDAGQCVLDNDNPSDPQAWRRCALDLVCAANTIRSYINRFGKDCNGDQLVTCEDYVMIHKNGGWNCGKSLVGSNFCDIYQTCKDVVISRGLSI